MFYRDTGKYISLLRLVGRILLCGSGQVCSGLRFQICRLHGEEFQLRQLRGGRLFGRARSFLGRYESLEVTAYPPSGVVQVESHEALRGSMACDCSEVLGLALAPSENCDVLLLQLAA
mgnify:CR=1 FL=1